MNIVVEGGEILVLLEGHRVPCELNGVSSELSDGVYELSGVAPISAENHDSPKTFNIDFNMSLDTLATDPDYHPPTQATEVVRNQKDPS